jgi:hypothetical protein
MRERRIVHGASLRYFPIFCKRLSPESTLFDRLNDLQIDLDTAERRETPFRLLKAALVQFFCADALAERRCGKSTLYSYPAITKPTTSGLRARLTLNLVESVFFLEWRQKPDCPKSAGPD